MLPLGHLMAHDFYDIQLRQEVMPEQLSEQHHTDYKYLASRKLSLSSSFIPTNMCSWCACLITFRCGNAKHIQFGIIPDTRISTPDCATLRYLSDLVAPDSVMVVEMLSGVPAHGAGKPDKGRTPSPDGLSDYLPALLVPSVITSERVPETLVIRAQAWHRTGRMGCQFQHVQQRQI